MASRSNTLMRLAAVLTILHGGAMIGTAQAITGSNEVLIGPVSIPADYVGIDLSVPARVFVSIGATPAGLDIGIRMQGDLGNLQNKIGQVVDSFPLPKNNCASYSLINQVVTIWGKQLQTSGTSATLMLHGYVEIWSCVSNPIPNSKVEWRNDGPFHLSIPHVVTWPGDPIKTIVAKQPFDVSLPIALQVVDDHTVALRSGPPSITLGGQYVGITNTILNIAGVDINAKATEALSYAIAPDKRQQALPSETLKLNPKIASAVFVDDSGVLGVQIAMSSHLPPDQLTGLLQVIANKKP